MAEGYGQGEAGVWVGGAGLGWEDGSREVFVHVGATDAAVGEAEADVVGAELSDLVRLRDRRRGVDVLLSRSVFNADVSLGVEAERLYRGHRGRASRDCEIANGVRCLMVASEKDVSATGSKTSLLSLKYQFPTEGISVEMGDTGSDPAPCSDALLHWLAIQRHGQERHVLSLWEVNRCIE